MMRLSLSRSRRVPPVTGGDESVLFSKEARIRVVPRSIVIDTASLKKRDAVFLLFLKRRRNGNERDRDL